MCICFVELNIQDIGFSKYIYEIISFDYKRFDSFQIMHCVQIYSGDFCRTSTSKRLNISDIVRAPSVHVATEFVHQLLYKVCNLLVFKKVAP